MRLPKAGRLPSLEMRWSVALLPYASPEVSSCIASSFLRSITRLTGLLEVTALHGPLHCEDVCTKRIDQRFALVVESCRRTTRCTFPSEREESRVHSTAAVMDLLGVLLTIIFLANGSVIRSGMLSICSALIPFPHLPALESSAASLTQTPRDASSRGFFPFGRFPAVSEITVGHLFGIFGSTASVSALSSTSFYLLF